jgi:hypothetical protein
MTDPRNEIIQCAVSYDEWPTWRDETDPMRLALGDTIELFSNCLNLNRPLELTINWDRFKYEHLAECFEGGKRIRAIHNLSTGIQKFRKQPGVVLVPVLLKEGADQSHELIQTTDQHV